MDCLVLCSVINFVGDSQVKSLGKADYSEYPQRIVEESFQWVDWRARNPPLHVINSLPREVLDFPFVDVVK